MMLVLKLVLVASLILGLALFGMSVKIVFHKSHRFPETSVGHSKELRKRGVSCPRTEEIKSWRKNAKKADCSTCYGHVCEVD